MASKNNDVFVAALAVGLAALVFGQSPTPNTRPCPPDAPWCPAPILPWPAPSPSPPPLEPAPEPLDDDLIYPGPPRRP